MQDTRGKTKDNRQHSELKYISVCVYTYIVIKQWQFFLSGGFEGGAFLAAEEAVREQVRRQIVPRGKYLTPGISLM
jgi:hypothetical protein